MHPGLSIEDPGRVRIGGGERGIFGEDGKGENRDCGWRFETFRVSSPPTFLMKMPDLLKNRWRKNQTLFYKPL
jgi:hypothetical protein